ncbi:hypothetical protein BB559_000303 [Furculomyces boomerangus]|uniref:AMP-dependent synthetase/ligase domain-containing protein n=2 Tax=Harpellales TaxID=61421 RepID=A0A2T9Z5N3_9FUNG|nr:hypothetical protein BB559_000303 [Furculomyces boomerangus]PWA02042.1 hypothetical protein BB558_001854 [Smittium angustum]
MIFKSNIPDQEIPAVDLATYVINEGKRVTKTLPNPDNFALYDEDTHQSLKIHEVEEQSSKLASGLLNKMNFCTDDVALVFSSNALNYTIAMLGTLMAGGIITLANPTYKPRELAFQLKDSKSKYIFTKLEFIDTVLEAIKLSEMQISNKNIILIDHNQNYSGPFNSIDRIYSNQPFTRFTINSLEQAKKKTAFLPYSSGTTGFPKGVILSHLNSVANTIQMSIPENLDGWYSDRSVTHRYLAVLPYYHIYGLAIITCVGLANAIGIVSLGKFELERYMQTVQKHKITLAHLVPPIINRIVNDPIIDKYDFSSVKRVMTAASPLSEDLAKRLIEKFNVKIVQIYGLTETSPAVTVSRIGSWERRSNGALTCNVTAKVIDEHGNLLKANELGEMCFKGPNIMNGYLNNPESTKITIDEDGYLHSGDIGYIDESSNLYLVERKKELIKFKGFQVAPAEIESLLIGNEYVFECAVIGVYNEEQATEVPKAYISLKPQYRNFTEEEKKEKANEIIEWLSAQVAPHKRLRGGITFVEEIPKTLSGKILRRNVRDIENAKQAISKQTPKL